jgi:hypothetical protein
MKNDFLILYFRLKMTDEKIAGHGAYVETITCRVTFKRQLNSSRIEAWNQFVRLHISPEHSLALSPTMWEATLLI